MNASEKLNICRQCPLWKETINGPVCNSNKWIEPKTNNSSFFPKSGYVKGCACLLERKTADPNSHCVADKW